MFFYISNALQTYENSQHSSEIFPKTFQAAFRHPQDAARPTQDPPGPARSVYDIFFVAFISVQPLNSRNTTKNNEF